MLSQHQYNGSRRTALAYSLSAALLPITSAFAKNSEFPDLSLKMYNLHTAESINTVFWANGKYQNEALRELNHFLRDHRTDQVKPIDTRIFSLLYLLNSKLDNDKPISVISGYRSPQTNLMLAERNAGVARNSYHVKGQAIDIRIPGKNTRDLRDIGIKLGVGGVGYYQRSDFAHFDTGPRRSW